MFEVNIVDFFDIFFFNNAYVLNKSSLTGSYDNSIVFQIDKVYYSI